MTAIVDPKIFKSKAALKLAAEAGTLVIRDPQPGAAPDRVIHCTNMIPFDSYIVTNHPLRTKFATIKRTPTGWEVK